MPRSELSFSPELLVIREVRDLLIRERAPFEVIGPRLASAQEPTAAGRHGLAPTDGDTVEGQEAAIAFEAGPDHETGGPDE
jgi:hypothetical protein